MSANENQPAALDNQNPVGSGSQKLSQLLDAIEERANKATLGPWSIKWAAQIGRRCVHSGRNIVDGELIGTSIPELDAAFIASSRTDVPKLVTIAREQDAVIAQVADYFAVTTRSLRTMGDYAWADSMDKFAKRVLSEHYNAAVEALDSLK